MSTAQETGTRDVVYNVISVAYHALQGAETYGTYAQDAEQAGDAEAADYFRQVQQEAVQAADQAKTLLKSRLSGA
jgi:rubrerythrin